jgi:hypothetical protein
LQGSLTGRLVGQTIADLPIDRASVGSDVEATEMGQRQNELDGQGEQGQPGVSAH